MDGMFKVTAYVRTREEANALMGKLATEQSIECIMVVSPTATEPVRQAAPKARVVKVSGGMSPMPGFLREIIEKVMAEDCASCDDRECPNHPVNVALHKARNSN